MTRPCTRPIAINPFQFGSGAWFGGGAASIQPAPVPYMSGKTLFTNNTNVNFDLRCTVDGLCIDVADSGGNLNLRIKGVFKNFNDFGDIDGMVIGGVVVSVSYGPGGQPQTVCLCGLVSDFLDRRTGVIP